MLDPRRVLTFLAVAEHGSFSRAADALALTQSAVSQQIATLERGLGIRLLHRGSGPQALTPAGAQLLPHARALAERLALAGEQLADEAAREHRELRIGGFPSALATIVPSALSALLRRVGDVRVSVTEGRLDVLVGSVRSGALHLALAFQDAGAPRREHQATRRQDLFDEPFVALLPPRHRLARRDTIALGDLAGDTWCAPSRDGLIASACRAAGFTPNIAYLATDPLATRGLVRAGLAVTLTPRGLAEHLGGVRVTRLDGDPARRSVYAVLPDAGMRPLDRQLLEELTPRAEDGNDEGPQA